MKISRAFQAVGVAAVIGASMAALPSPRAATGVSVTLSPDSISGMSGQVKVVTMTADMGSSGFTLGSYHALVSWDSTVIRVDSVVPSSALGSPVVRYVNGASVDMTAASGGSASGAFALGTFYFHFVSDAIGSNSAITTQFLEFVAGDFTDLLPSLSAPGGHAYVAPPKVQLSMSPLALHQRVGYKPEFDIVADLTSDADVALGSYTGTLDWDNTVMVFDSVKIGGFAMPQINASAGHLDLTAADATGTGVGGVVTLARLFFSYASSTYPVQTGIAVNMSEMHAASSFANLVQGVNSHDGRAFIDGYLRGDIDISDTITALDAQLILQAVVGLTTGGVPPGDADCNAALSAKDAQIVLNKVVGNAAANPFCVGTIQ
ncbi:MAG TPA: hypothetical protein VJ867_09455 [Gemmatimonadaceae bacterium]|nr:hypothetical protein [Gemmatimonadaceae bacterium]